MFHTSQSSIIMVSLFVQDYILSFLFSLILPLSLLQILGLLLLLLLCSHSEIAQYSVGLDFLKEWNEKALPKNLKENLLK